MMLSVAKSICDRTLKKLFASFCLISMGFAVCDDIPFKNLDVKLAEAGVPKELLPMNHHIAAQKVKNVRFIFGVGQNLRFYSCPKAVRFDRLLFPQSSTAAFIEMLFPNPYMFAANQSPNAISRIPFMNLGLLVRHLVNNNHDAAIDTFVGAISIVTNSSSQSFEEADPLKFQRISFYQEIRRQIQEQLDAMFDEDDVVEFFKDVPDDKRVTHVIKNKYPELQLDGADLIAGGFFDDRSEPTVAENLQKLQNKTFVITLQKAITEVQSDTTNYTRSILVEAINTFAWKKFKGTDNILDYYKGITGNEVLALDFETFSFEQIRHASRLLEEERELSRDLYPHFRTAIVKYTLIQAAPPFSVVSHRHATYIDPASKRKTALVFADCVESQARAFFNGIVHQSTELGITFNPNLLPIDAPVSLFYQEFSSPEHIATQAAHDKFAVLVAKQPEVKYATPKNQPDISKRVAEVWAGNLNLVKVLCHMSGCYSQLEPFIVGITSETAQNLLEDALQILSTHLSRPGFSLEFDCDSNIGSDLTYDRTLNDITGDILGKINDEKAFLLKSSSSHGELIPLVKHKHTWLNDLPSVGSEFETLPDDLKHYVYLGMSSATLSGLDPVLQRAIILNCPLDDIDTQIDRSIHCFAQSNPLVRELALPIAHRVIAVDDFHGTKRLVSSILKLLKADPLCLSENEFMALCHHNFLEATAITEVVKGADRQIDNFMTAYGYKKGWLTEANLKETHDLSFYRWNTLHELIEVTSFESNDYINILKICPTIENLYYCYLPKKHTSATQLINEISHLSKLISLNIHSLDFSENNLLFMSINTLPKALERLNIGGSYFNIGAQDVLIKTTIDCVKYLPALKQLSLSVENEKMLRCVLRILRTESLPIERIAIDYPCFNGEQLHEHQARVFKAYQEEVHVTAVLHKSN